MLVVMHTQFVALLAVRVERLDGELRAVAAVDGEVRQSPVEAAQEADADRLRRLARAQHGQAGEGQRTDRRDAQGGHALAWDTRKAGGPA